ncbi:MAG: ThuA domain-containing protein [Bryobacteraceae bacterium]
MLTRRVALGAMAAPLLARTKATAFALIGDRYHNSDYIRTGLTKTMAEAGVTVDFCDETKMLDAEQLHGYKLLIILRDGMTWPDGYPDENTNAAWVKTGSPALVSDPPVPKHRSEPHYWIRPEQGKAVKQFVQNGGGALFMHNVTYIAPHDPDFRDVLGAETQGHPPIRKFKVKVTNPNHPITRGVRDFIVTDEQHYMKYQKDPKHLLLESVNEEGLDYNKLGPKAPAGWAYDYGKGRVCYLGPGHLLTVLWNPEYVKLQQNAANWLLKKTS